MNLLQGQSPRRNRGLRALLKGTMVMAHGFLRGTK